MPILPFPHLIQPRFPQASLESGGGLTVVADGIPVIHGSGFQYYEPGWAKGYYSSRYEQQPVRRLADGATELSFASDDGLASGSETLRQEGDLLTVDYVFNWSGPSPAKIEVTLGNLWAPVFEGGKVVAAGTSGDLRQRTYKSTSDLEERRFTPDSRSYTMSSHLGKLEITADAPMTLFDARGYAYADGDQPLWLGVQGLDVSAGHPASLHCTYKIGLHAPAVGGAVTRSLQPAEAKNLIEPDEDLPVLIPKPQFAALHFESPVAITGFRIPQSKALENVLVGALSRRFVVAPRGAGKIRCRIAVSPPRSSSSRRANGVGSEAPGSYDLSIGREEVFIRAADEEGARQSLERLASLCFAKDGKLWLPVGRITDAPGIGWRGVHLFVGPTANAFHRKLWDRVLKPLGFNHVILQCERTSWQSLPGIDTPITMKRADLVRLFDYYRSIGVDPIPLVQSFGHAEWMFAHHQNLDLALNRDVPYAVDPRKPRTRQVLSALWNEILSTLKPKTVHFGLDEVDMRGWKPDPKFVTAMWKLQVPFLASLAEKHHVQMMLWGDEGLAPDQAIDATNGVNDAEAAERRSVIPKGTLIGDWHYAGNPDPAKFETSLNLWKKGGQRPIASAWFNAQNIRSFFDAAHSTASEGALVTTWAGYESSEDTMLAALNQYSAMMVAADYAWNPRLDPVSSLSYDPMQVLKKMYFDEASPVVARPGLEYGDGPASERRIGRVNFRMLKEPLRSGSILSNDGGSASEISVALEGTGHRLFLALSADRAVEDGKTIAQVEIGLEGSRPLIYSLRYGQQVRAEGQKGVCVLADRTDGISAIGLDLPAGKTVRYCRITQINRLSGLTVHGVSIAQ